ncbi:MAG: hypothetical protein PHD02_02455 [Bacilli bacterium]|nr:hypothetical protein [Bacilli bacterium]
MRCKRCGSPLSFEDIYCKGCGKSLIDLRASDEIEFDDNAKLNIEPIKKTEEPHVAPIEEKAPEDIFGEAVYGENKEEQTLEPAAPTNQVPTIEPVNFTNSVPEIEPIAPVQPVTPVPLEEPIENVTMQSNTPIEDVEMPTTPVANNETPKKEKELDKSFVDKKSKKGLFFAILALIVLVLGGTFGYFYVKTAPKKIFANAINGLLTDVNINTDFKTVQAESYFKINVTNPSEDNAIYDLLNSLEIDFSTSIDTVNNTLIANLTGKYENEDIINGTVYNTQNETYLYLDNIYDKYIKLDLLSDEDIETMYDDTSNSDDQIKMLNLLIEEVNNSLKDKYFSRKLNGTSIDSALNMNNEEFKEFITTLYTNIKNNDQLLEYLASSMSMTKEELIESIDSDLEDIDSITMSSLELVITTDILSSKIQNVSLTIDDDSINIEVVDDNTYNFNIKTIEDETNGSLIIKDNNGFKEYTFSIEDETYGTLSCIFGYKLTYDEEITLPTFGNYIDYIDISEDDYNTIMENLFQSDASINFYTALTEAFLADESLDDTIEE